MGTSAALGSIAQTGINLAHASRFLSDRGADLVITERVAGAHDHGRAPNRQSEPTPRRRRSPQRHRSILQPVRSSRFGTSRHSMFATMRVPDDAQLATGIPLWFPPVSFVTNTGTTLGESVQLHLAIDDSHFTFGDRGRSSPAAAACIGGCSSPTAAPPQPYSTTRCCAGIPISASLIFYPPFRRIYERTGRSRYRCADMISASELALEKLMQAKLQHPDLIEALFTIAGGDAELVERAVVSSAQRVDAAHLLKLVEYIIANRQKGRSRSVH